MVRRKRKTKKGGSEMLKKNKTHLEHLTMNWVTWQQVSNVTGYKKSITERLSASEVKMGRGSRLYKGLCWGNRNTFKYLCINSRHDSVVSFASLWTQIVDVSTSDKWNSKLAMSLCYGLCLFCNGSHSVSTCVLHSVPAVLDTGLKMIMMTMILYNDN